MSGLPFLCGAQIFRGFLIDTWAWLFDSIFTPLIFSAILYGSDGRVHISYIDALFNSVSALTVCGLTTVDLSGLTNFQQVVLFFLMCIGNPVRFLLRVRSLCYR